MVADNQTRDNLVHLEAASPNSHEHEVHDEHNPRHGDNVKLVGDVGGSSNDSVVDAFDLDNLIFLEPNDDDKQSEEDLDDDGDGDESDDIHGDDPIRGLDMLL
ncbi:hypothetical protein JHK84_055484 [Glycine max]|nr:hypothetical protein JHK86_055447 [Glycine max]KAG4909594.1 hypothetical protein JHK87_055710 [Glycine soja]KAG4918176.1 hypothetical protein JHK85_056457 [Glycine max]KAG5074253.1 hypothetical protein JHK84_055484 [Glycine max]